MNYDAYINALSISAIENLDDVSFKILKFIYDKGSKLLKKHGTVQHITASVGYPYMKVYNSLHSLIDNGFIIQDEEAGIVKFELNPKVVSYFDDLLSADDENCTDSDLQYEDEEKQNTIKYNGNYEIDDSNKQGAIYELVNDTLKKTIDFCQSLLLEIDSNKATELIKQFRDKNIELSNEIESLKKELRDAEQLVKYYHTRIEDLKDFCESQMNYLLSSIDDKINSFFELIVWAQQQNKSKFINDVLNEIRETKENILSRF